MDQVLCDERLWPDQVTADTTYRTIENIVPIEDARISAYLPLSVLPVP